MKQDNLLTVANVGDSRAIMGRINNKTWMAKELSRDHKVFFLFNLNSRVSKARLKEYINLMVESIALETNMDSH